jgi:hypothetical protein
VKNHHGASEYSTEPDASEYSAGCIGDIADLASIAHRSITIQDFDTGDCGGQSEQEGQPATSSTLR